MIVNEKILFEEMAFQKMFINEKTHFYIQNRNYFKDIMNFLEKSEMPADFKLSSNFLKNISLFKF